MTTVTRIPHLVQDFNTLYQACVVMGDADATVTINGSCEITSSILSAAQINTAIDMSTVGQLFANKTLKIKGVSDKSDELQDEGVESWTTGAFIELTESRAEEIFSLYRFYVDNPSELSASKKYMVMTLNGRAPLNLNDTQSRT